MVQQRESRGFPEPGKAGRLSHHAAATKVRAISAAMTLPSRFLRIAACLAFALPAPLPLPAQQNSGSNPAATSLDALIAGENPWSVTQDQLEQSMKGARLQWLTEQRDQARFFGNYALCGGELPVSEAIAEFQAGKLFRVNFSLYNRGDAGREISTRAEFDQRIEAFKKSITNRIGVAPVDLGRQQQSAVKATGFAWTKAPSVWLLEYSVMKDARATGVQFRPEFIRLRVYELPKKTGFGTQNPVATTSQRVSKKALTENIAKEANGDVFLKNVPMVDQGPKGYCAVATAERVFRYYGMPVDQHEMAQVAKTGQGGGTNPEEMLKALTDLQARLRVRVRAISKWEYQEFTQMITDYNREAKRNKKPEINLAGMRVIDIGGIYQSMDPDSLKASRTVRSKAGFEKFKRAIAERIEKGIPLMWGVQLGLFPEPGIPQSGGGHMRLIIGYNVKTNELIFSDSWGADHAMKRMPLDNAYSMTTGLYYMEPFE